MAIVTVDGLSKRYPGAAAPVLRGISFRAEAGKTTAIIGSTGAGKTTLISLVARLFEQKLLGHTQVQTTARYAHLAADPIKLAANHVSAEIAILLNGQAA